ncbi:MAG TPA: cation:proton antiporter, partial [Caulobacteraceae bacterium]|nr:cation:proton antiporter [Caulobacteraceae bacterium]
MAVDPYILFLLGFGLIALLVAWIPLALKELPLSLAIICVVIGLLVFGSGALSFEPSPRTWDTVTEKLTELVVIVALMGAGLKLDRRVGWKRWAVTWRLLAIAMPLTIAGIAVLGVQVLGFSLAMALLLAASLAPTDPVLASDVQTGPPRSGEDGEVRFGLTSEAGLNDGLAFPFVNLALVFAAATAAMPDARSLGEWLAIDVAWKIACGIGVGWLIGRVLGWWTFHVPRVRLSGTGDGLVALGATFVAYGATEVVHGYGFLAVFVAALTLRSTERNHEYHEALHDFAEQIERLLMMLVLVLFGGAIVTGLFAPLTWTDAAVAVVILLVIRPLAGFVSLVGSPHPLRDRALLAFLGIRGIGTFYYLAYGLNHGEFGVSDR